MLYHENYRKIKQKIENSTKLKFLTKNHRMFRNIKINVSTIIIIISHIFNNRHNFKN